jgi:hypothetical protein
MLFAGSFEPAYAMCVYALPSQVQTTVNKRNAALIQRHMEESIGVPPSRGYLRFIAVPEENVAYNGKTTAAEITEATQDLDFPDDHDAVPWRTKSARKRLYVKVRSETISKSMECEEANFREALLVDVQEYVVQYEFTNAVYAASCCGRPRACSASPHRTGFARACRNGSW